MIFECLYYPAVVTIYLKNHIGVFFLTRGGQCSAIEFVYP